MELLDSVKRGMTPPIKSTAYDTSLSLLIEACLRDLYHAGVKRFGQDGFGTIGIDNPMISLACVLFCKANGYDDAGEHYTKAYEVFKNGLAISAEYRGGADGKTG